MLKTFDVRWIYGDGILVALFSLGVFELVFV